MEQNSRLLHGRPDEVPPFEPPEEPPHTEIDRHPRSRQPNKIDILENEVAQLRQELRDHINPPPKKKDNDEQPKKKWTTKKIILVLIGMVIVAIIFYNLYLVVAKGYTF